VTQFSDLGLADPILKALAADGYAAPTPIQAQAIPPVLAGRDLVALAQTGTGKTAAFALPILHRLAATRRPVGDRGCRVLVLAPTRELAAQIGESFRAYGRFLNLKTAVVFGGASMHKQKMALAGGVDVLVATPGRLIDHVGERTLRLDRVEILVLDEADHMLDMGFIHALKRIAALLPKARQSLFFSATMPGPIADLAATFLTDPVQAAVAPAATTAERVEQAIIHVEAGQKQDLLHALLADQAIARALVFSRTKHGADRIARKLSGAGFAAEAIHGNKSQGQRTRALDAFKAGKVRLLVATEIAARGIDVDGVTHVINFDLPNVPEQYVHRIGRTARGGAGGMAISFCASDERPYLRDIERLIRQSVPVMEHPLGLSRSAAAAPGPGNSPTRGAGRGRGRRPAQAGAAHGSGAAQPRGQPKGPAQGQTQGRPRGPSAGQGADQARGQAGGQAAGQAGAAHGKRHGHGQGQKQGHRQEPTRKPEGPSTAGPGKSGDGRHAGQRQRAQNRRRSRG
jgi:ATP-dependent RNA helicase RhlE